jgi:NitT/TauT family transport system permease protein
MKLERSGALIVQAALIAAFLAAWEVAASKHWVNGQFFGSPSGIVTSLLRSINDGSLMRDAGLTVYETIAGFVLGTIVGTVIGLLLWYSRFAARVIEPIAVAMNGIPKIALAPLIIIWLGAGTTSKIVLAFASTAVVAFLAAYGGTREIDADLVTLLRTFGASRVQTFVKLIVPASLPWIFSAMRINVGFALVGSIAGEFISSQYGIGHAIFVAGNLFDLNGVWLGIFELSLLAALMYAALGLLERVAMRGRA